MSDRYPGYDVLSKRHTPSWNAATREVIDARLSVPAEPRFFTSDERRTAAAACGRILPQPSDRPAVPIVALLDEKLFLDRREGWRHAAMPPQREAWRRGLAALQAEAAAADGASFDALAPAGQDRLIGAMQRGELHDPAWGDMPPKLFFEDRLLSDTIRLYYAHPTAWNEIGFGGPAAPRGYVRLDKDQRDPWEAAEARPGHEADAGRRNRDVGRR